MSQTYATKTKSAAPAAQKKAVENISKSDMLRMSGAGAPQPMSPALREKFEPGFSADFSNIRISRGHIPEEMGVQAVAKGTDILLDSSAGMDVLGHELAHVVQQAQGRVGSGFPVVHDAALERQADVMGARAASGLSAVEGGMPGIGGETMSIAPMSDASAPAQCKSMNEKKYEKAVTDYNKRVNDDVYQASEEKLKANDRNLFTTQFTKEELAARKKKEDAGRRMKKYRAKVRKDKGREKEYWDNKDKIAAAERAYKYSEARQQVREAYGKARDVSMKQHYGGLSQKEREALEPERQALMAEGDAAQKQTRGQLEHLHHLKSRKYMFNT